MRILGIDPGSRITGFGVIQILRNGALSYVASGCVRIPKGELAGRLKTVYDGVAEIIRTYQPTVLAIEKVFMAANADSALKLGQARGAAIVAAAVAGVPVAEYTPAEIKLSIVGHGRASKAQIEFMVGRLLGLATLPRADAADALAGALCHAQHMTMTTPAVGRPGA